MSADELSETQDPALYLSVLSPSEPEMLKKAFIMLVDGIVEQSAGYILDWGTVEVGSRRHLHPETGQELTQIMMALRGMRASK